MKFYSNYWVILAICLPIGILAFNRPLCETDSALETLKVWGREIFAISGYESYNSNWWFNTLIISLYLFFPILYYSVKQAPLWTLVIAYALNRLSFVKISMDMSIYSFIFVIGMVLAVHQEKIKFGLNKLPLWLLWTMSVISILTPALLLPLFDHGVIHYDGIHLYALLTIGIVMQIVLAMRKIKWLSDVFMILGVHSINIYLIHKFLFYYWFPDFFYSLQYPIFILGTLMAICLLISCVIEYAKEKSGYNNSINLLLSKIR